MSSVGLRELFRPCCLVLIWTALVGPVGTAQAQSTACSVVGLEKNYSDRTWDLVGVDASGQGVWSRWYYYVDHDPAAYELDATTGNTYILLKSGALEVVDCRGQSASTTQLRELFPGLAPQSAFTGVIESFDPFRMSLWLMERDEISLHELSGLVDPVVTEQFRCPLDGDSGPLIRYGLSDDYHGTYPYTARVEGPVLNWALGEWAPAPGEPGGYWDRRARFAFDTESREWLSPPFGQQVEITPSGQGIVARAVDGSIQFEAQFDGVVLSATRSRVGDSWSASVLVGAAEGGGGASWYRYDALGDLLERDTFGENSEVIAQHRWPRTCSSAYGWNIYADEVFVTTGREEYSSTVHVLDHGLSKKTQQHSAALRAVGAKYVEFLYSYYIFGASDSGFGALTSVEMDCWDWLPRNRTLSIFDGSDGGPVLPPLVQLRSFPSSLSVGFPNTHQLRASSGVHVPIRGLSPDDFECYIYDLDGDARVTRGDEFLIVGELIATQKTFTDEQRCAADVNEDGQIDISDAMSVRIVGQGGHHADEMDSPTPFFDIVEVAPRAEFTEVVLSVQHPDLGSVALDLRIDANGAAHDVVSVVVDGPEDAAIQARAGSEARVVGTHTPFSTITLQFALDPYTGRGPEFLRVLGTWSTIDGFLRDLDSSVFKVRTGLAIDDPSAPVVPAQGPRLLGARPNPFNPQTEVRFELARAGHVELVVFDSRGRRVVQLLNELLPAGPGMVHWDGTDQSGVAASSGVYWIRLVSDGIADSGKVVLVR